MNQAAIQRCLHKLRYEGGWSFRALSQQTGLAASTIKASMTEQCSEQVQARLSQVLPMVPRNQPKKERKGKPGHFKRYLIRYYNLKGWLAEIEKEPGIDRRFVNPKKYNMSRDDAAYTCCRYDYQLKTHLLSLFGEVLRQRRIVMCDAYPAESWIERIHKEIPGARPALFKKIMQRGDLKPER